MRIPEGVRPARWLATFSLFGVPGAVFGFLFHWLGPQLRGAGISWWNIFHLLLIVPLVLMLIAAIVGAALDGGNSWKTLLQRLRLSKPSGTAWFWAVALSGFMFGGNCADVGAVIAAWLALRREKSQSVWLYVSVFLAVLAKRNAGMLQPALQHVNFFDPSGFHNEFFSHFGPKDFMGIPLPGTWWILFYYATVMIVSNIGGEELWWRGYVLPRQEAAFGRLAWLVHGVFWSAFHLFMQPTLWDTVRMAITGLALSFVALRTKSTWPGIVGHAFGDLAFFLSLVRGVIAR